MANPANESGRKKRLFHVIYRKVGFYIPAFTAHLSAWLAPKCFLALSVLIESVLSCLEGPAAFLASVSKVPPAPAPTTPLYPLCLSVCARFARLLLREERRGPAKPLEGHRLPLASSKVERFAVGGDPL